MAREQAGRVVLVALGRLRDHVDQVGAEQLGFRSALLRHLVRRVAAKQLVLRLPEDSPRRGAARSRFSLGIALGLPRRLPLCQPRGARTARTLHLRRWRLGPVRWGSEEHPPERIPGCLLAHPLGLGDRACGRRSEAMAPDRRHSRHRRCRGPSPPSRRRAAQVHWSLSDLLRRFDHAPERPTARGASLCAQYSAARCRLACHVSRERLDPSGSVVIAPRSGTLSLAEQVGAHDIAPLTGWRGCRAGLQGTAPGPSQ